MVGTVSTRYESNVEYIIITRYENYVEYVITTRYENNVEYIIITGSASTSYRCCTESVSAVHMLQATNDLLEQCCEVQGRTNFKSPWPSYNIFSSLIYSSQSKTSRSMFAAWKLIQEYPDVSLY